MIWSHKLGLLGVDTGNGQALKCWGVVQNWWVEIVAKCQNCIQVVFSSIDIVHNDIAILISYWFNMQSCSDLISCRFHLNLEARTEVGHIDLFIYPPFSLFFTSPFVVLQSVNLTDPLTHTTRPVSHNMCSISLVEDQGQDVSFQHFMGSI